MSKKTPQPTPTPSTPPLRQPEPVGVSDTSAGIRESLTRGLQSVGHDPMPEPQPNADAASEKLLADLLAVLTPLAGTRGNQGAVELLETIVEESRSYRALAAVLRPELRDGETEEAAITRLSSETRAHQSLVKVLDTGEGWTAYYAADTMRAQRVAIADALREANRHDVDQARAVRELLREHSDMRAALQPSFDTLGANANARGVIIHHVKGTGPGYDEGGRYGVTYLSVVDGAVSLAAIQEVGRDEKGASGIYPSMTWGTASDHLDKAVEDFLRPKAHRS